MVKGLIRRGGERRGGRGKHYRIIRTMKSIDVYVKVEIDLEEGESAEKLSREMVRMIQKMYGVRRAEVQNIQTHGEE
jgi:hypothetical protein